MIINIIMQVQNHMEKIQDFLKYMFFVFIGYFSPIHDVVRVVIFFFFIDVIYGWRVAVKLRNEKFNPSIVWRKTMPRVTLSLIALLLSYMLDTETGQQWFSTYKIIGWSISGLVFLSILKNGLVLTEWRAFSTLSKSIRNKVKKETGIEIKDSDI